MDRIKLVATVAFAAGLSASCGLLDAGLTSHSRAAATVGSSRLSAEDLGALIAESPIPDSAVTGYWAEQLAILWTDYVRLVSAYRSPDTTNALDYTSLLEERRYLAAVAVDRFRDSILFANVEPTDQQVREFYDLTKPFTRMHLRRIVLTVPEDTDDELRDELFAQAQALRARLAGGENFVELAREHSSEQLAARGQLLQFQGHDDFPAAADSMVYALAPGEVSPVVATAEAMLIYLVEEILAPEFDDVQEMTFNRLLEMRKDSVAASVVDTLVENARIAVRSGSVEVAREIADSDEDRVRGGADLVTYRGGEVTAGEVRQVFDARPDIKQLFVSGSDEDLGIYLHELARDEVLIRAAYRAGAQPSESQKEALRGVLAEQLSRIAANYRLSHQTVISPIFDAEAEALGFIERILLTRAPLPWLGEFRPVLDRDYPGRVDRHGADAAAAIAVSLRKEMAPAAPAAPAAGDGGDTDGHVEGETESGHSGE